jgi:isopentenyldiphosphate isomerase
MEQWDLYDIHRMKTGETWVRGQKMLEGNLHLVVHICVFNSKGEMLIQQRQPFKEGWPDRWDLTAGGSAVAGDTSQMAAERELFEEIGLHFNFENIRPYFTINFDYGFNDFYLIEQEVELSSLHLQEEEVQAVKWASKEDILHMILEEIFVPYHEGLIHLLFDMRNRRGTSQRKYKKD